MEDFPGTRGPCNCHTTKQRPCNCVKWHVSQGLGVPESGECGHNDERGDWCIFCALGDDLYTQMKLAHISWGYAVSENRLMITRHEPFEPHFYRHLKPATKATRAELTQAVREILDEIHDYHHRPPALTRQEWERQRDERLAKSRRPM